MLANLTLWKRYVKYRAFELIHGNQKNGFEGTEFLSQYNLANGR